MIFIFILTQKSNALSQKFVLGPILKKIWSSLNCSWITSSWDNPELHHQKKRKNKNYSLEKNWNDHFFSISDFFLQTFAISKQIKLQLPATSRLEEFLQSFQTVMDFLWFRSLVMPKLAKQSVCLFSLP